VRTFLKLTGEAAASILLLLVLAGPAFAGDPIDTVGATSTVTSSVSVTLGKDDCSSSCDGDTTDLTVDADLAVTADVAADLDLGKDDCSSSCDGGSGSNQDCDNEIPDGPPSDGPPSDGPPSDGPGSGPSAGSGDVFGSVSRTSPTTGRSFAAGSLPSTSTEAASASSDPLRSHWAFVVSLPLVLYALRRREVMPVR